MCGLYVNSSLTWHTSVYFISRVFLNAPRRLALPRDNDLNVRLWHWKEIRHLGLYLLLMSAVGIGFFTFIVLSMTNDQENGFKLQFNCLKITSASSGNANIRYNTELTTFNAHMNALGDRHIKNCPHELAMKEAKKQAKYAERKYRKAKKRHKKLKEEHQKLQRYSRLD